MQDSPVACSSPLFARQRSDKAAPMHDVIVIILSLDEEPNIEKAIASVRGFAQVVVIDSGSSDRTRELARGAGAEVIEHAFVDYADQRNFALDHVRDRAKWAFFLDADEELTPALCDEIEALVAEDAVDGAYVGYRFFVLGRELKHGPFASASVLRLMRTDKARFSRGTNERVDDRGLRVVTLRNKMRHADAKPLAAWFHKHVRYAEREAAHYIAGEDHLDGFRWSTKAGRAIGIRWAYNRLPLFVRPFIHFGRTIVWQHAWLDGFPGLFYAGMQSLWYPMMIDLFIYEHRVLESRTRSGRK
jgi:glycosyltransferase involved in cell wall biosynthesis